MPLTLNRRQFLAGTSLTALRAAAAPSPNCLLLSAAAAHRIRQALSRDAFMGTAQALYRNALTATKAGPWSVTSHRPDDVKADIHDYYSEGPYWWPDSKNPRGPYIRKDGERNPNRFQHNRSDLGDMCEAVLALGIGAWLLGEESFAERAARVLSVWFLDAKTRMNPNLEYGQAVRGINEGRGTGIIDTVSLIHAAQGVYLLEQTQRFDKSVAAGVRQWYADYLRWMTTSAKGLDEKKATNNHATWWTAQAAAYATFTGDEAVKKMAWERYSTFLLPGQVQPDGSCPREEARTRSLSYSSMNLDGFAVLCRLAEMNGVDLWDYRTPRGVGMETAFRYLMPYVLRPETWKKQQISAYEQDRAFFLGLGGLGLRSGELLSAYRRLPRASAPWIQFIDLIVKVR
jgi:hypothetical protein